MDKKEALEKLEGLSIEEKIAMLSETEEAYVRGFIEGAILDSRQAELHEKRQNNAKKHTKGVIHENDN